MQHYFEFSIQIHFVLHFRKAPLLLSYSRIMANCLLFLFFFIQRMKSFKTVP